MNAPTPTSTSGPVRPPRRLAAILAGLIVAVIVLVAGGVFWSQRPVEYRASTTLVVLPVSSAAEAAAYYDTLSRGQITTTLAEILALRAGEGAEDAEVSVEVVPDTSLIQLAVTAPDEAAAEDVADAALEQARPYFDQLGAPYAVSVVEPAEGTAEQVGLVAGVLAAVMVAVAAIAGLASYMAVRSIQLARASVAAAATPAPAEPAGPVPMAQQRPVPHPHTNGVPLRASSDNGELRTVPEGTGTDPGSQRPAR